MTNDWFTGTDPWWKQLRGARITKSEIAVIRALLPADDSRSVRLLRQAEHARKIERLPLAKYGYQLHILYVEDAKDLIDADSDFTSPPLMIADLVSGRKLKFTIKVLRGGFLNDLKGFTGDGGDWPRHWDIGDLAPAVPMNWLPPRISSEVRTEIIKRLASWVGTDTDRLLSLDSEYLIVHTPATDENIHAAELRLGFPLPPQYRQFVKICNGFSICRGRPYEVFGTGDVYSFRTGSVDDHPIAVTNLYEAGIVALSCGGNEIGKAIHIDSSATERESVGELRMHIRESLAWGEERYGL